ncbi:putative nuclease HARBI1 [Pleurodeles waltl]|uniref:putative nuclease HARBI1 n=1 Tax=Pleurodeles waltl TaxID=8319 RepID=UPI00370988EE
MEHFIVFLGVRTVRRMRGESAYAVRTCMMTPYLNPATPAEWRYNAAHRATRNMVERTFGLLKSRFLCLNRSGGPLQYSPKTTCRIVAACAIFHNIATTRGIPAEICEPESDEDDDPIPPLQPADRTSAAEGRQRRADITYNHFRCAVRR